MAQVFPLKDKVRYPSENMFKTRNVKSVRYGTETLAHLRPKIWSIITSDIKEEQSCKTYVRGLGYIN